MRALRYRHIVKIKSYCIPLYFRPILVAVVYGLNLSFYCNKGNKYSSPIQIFWYNTNQSTRAGTACLIPNTEEPPVKLGNNCMLRKIRAHI